MAKMDPKTPLQADHRFIKRFMETLDVQTYMIPSELSRVSRVFSRAGGSWERLFRGSVQDTLLLKQVIKTAYKQGFLTKKESWSGSKSKGE